MCGIAGFSLPATSKVNARKLSKQLLCKLEVRGNQAAGFAWAIGRQTGMYKQDVKGSQLKLRGMPKRVQNAILHTRLATHGSQRINANNHPVVSPKKQIALVHNGVIWNHDLIRPEIEGSLPEVDTSVISGLLEQQGNKALDKLDGDAAIAWLDDNNAGMLQVARIESSPLTICQTKTGEFIFASTQSILLDAIKKVGLEVDWLLDVPERILITVQQGIITSWENIAPLRKEYEEIISYSWKDKNNLRSASLGWQYNDPAFTDNLWDQNTEWSGKYPPNTKAETSWDGTKWVYSETYGDLEPEIDADITGDPDMFYGVDPQDFEIDSFEKFKKYFRSFWESSISDYIYYSKTTDEYVGNEDDLWDIFEQFRYEQSWLFKDRDSNMWSQADQWD